MCNEIDLSGATNEWVEQFRAASPHNHLVMHNAHVSRSEQFRLYLGHMLGMYLNEVAVSRRQVMLRVSDLSRDNIARLMSVTFVTQEGEQLVLHGMSSAAESVCEYDQEHLEHRIEITFAVPRS